VFIDFEIRRALIESAIRDYDVEKERIKNDWVLQFRKSLWGAWL
jgi:hypothetical protein